MTRLRRWRVLAGAHVDRGADGTWTKTLVWPEDLDDIPEEIDRLR